MFRNGAARALSLTAGLGAVLAVTSIPALAGDDQDPPEPPFVNLSDEMRARGTYIFQFSDEVPASRIPEHAAALTRAVGGQLRHTYTDVVRGFAATMPSTAMLRVLDIAEDEIVSVQQDGIVHVLGHCHINPNHKGCGGGGGSGGDGEGPTVGGAVGSCSSASPQEVTRAWGVDRVDAEVVLAAGKCGVGVDVYVLDTGVDLDHADLVPISSAVDCTSGCVPGGDDKNGHGTHVSGTIAARANDSDVVGVASGAKLHAVKVLGNSGRGYYSDIIAGIQHVVRQVAGKPVVINMSLGGSGGKSGTCDANGYSPANSDAFHEALCDAAHAGVVTVVAAGNSGADAEGHIPAAYDDAVLTVTATNLTSSGDDFPYWSNWGDGTSTGAAPAPVAIAAPGESVRSTAKGGGTTTMSGTSMASPHVAGAAVLHMEGKVLDSFADNSVDPSYYSAFISARDAIMGSSESTEFFTKEQKKPHSEGFLDVYKLICPSGCPSS